MGEGGVRHGVTATREVCELEGEELGDEFAAGADEEREGGTLAEGSQGLFGPVANGSEEDCGNWERRRGVSAGPSGMPTPLRETVVELNTRDEWRRVPKRELDASAGVGRVEEGGAC
jgi:hypothetical protein